MGTSTTTTTEQTATIEATPTKRMAWMNHRAFGRAAYQPTTVEHWANMVSHGVFVIPALYGAKILLESATSDLHRYVSTIYGFALVGLFTVSTFFHIFFYCGHYRNVKEVLHRGDRAMIYIFIASSYTPWLLLKPLPLESWAIHLRWGIWALAVIGIIYQQIFHERFKMLETCIYLTIGLLPSIAVMEMDENTGLSELKLGGLIYVLGVIFFKMDGRIPLAHAIWHLMVVLGAFVHYHAVLTYLFLPQTGEDDKQLKDNIVAGLKITDKMSCNSDDCSLL